jgi:hypothetical protein
MNRLTSMAAITVLFVFANSADAQFQLRLPWTTRPVGNCPGGVCPTPGYNAAYRAPANPASYQPQSQRWQPTGYQSQWAPTQNYSLPRPGYNANCPNGRCNLPQYRTNSATPRYDSTYQYSTPSSNQRYQDWTSTRYEPQAYERGAALNIPRGMEGISALPRSEQSAALQQRTCPVTRQLLGSMGQPVRVTVAGRAVYTCCPDCAEQLRRNPSYYLGSAELSTATSIR